jgi:hypothetical protein
LADPRVNERVGLQALVDCSLYLGFWQQLATCGRSNQLNVTAAETPQRLTGVAVLEIGKSHPIASFFGSLPHRLTD